MATALLSVAGPQSFTVTATDSNAVATSSTVDYSVIAARPTIGKLTQAAARWLERRGAGSRLPLGTAFAFSLDQPASVTLRFTRLVGGRLAAGHCVAAARAPAHARRCVRTINAGSVTLANAPSGADRLPFTGRTSLGLLAPGAYSVQVVATGLSGQPSASVSLRFTVAKPPRRSAAHRATAR